MVEQSCFELFGQKVKKIRNDIKVKKKQGREVHLTMEAFGEEVGNYFGKVALTRDDVNNLERGKRHLTQKDMDILLAILKVFHDHQVVNTLQEANDLLAVNRLAGLSPEQAAGIDPAWEQEAREHSAAGIEVTRGDLLLEDISYIPRRPDLFVGRDRDMEALKSRLFSSEKQSRRMHVLTAMRGWPGVGKTALASALANDPEVRAYFPDGILWATLGQNPNFVSILQIWGRILRDSQSTQCADANSASRNMKRVLGKKRALLVIDDIWDPEDARPFLIAGDNCATLFTTRRYDTALDITNRETLIYPVEVLDKNYSLDLLKALAGEVVERYPQECYELLTDVNGLPLAIHVAGRLLQTEYRAGLNVPRLINEMKNSALLLESKAPMDLTDLEKETTPTVAALLMKSVNSLDEQTKEYFSLLGTFAESPAVITLDALKMSWQTDHPDPIIRTLVGHGLLEHMTGTDMYKMHGILKILARSLWVNKTGE
jgi:hypothetical protein